MSMEDYDDYDDREARPVRQPAKRTGIEVRLTQISGQWTSENGIASYSIIGLDMDGKVYRYDARDAGWIPWSMETLEPIVEVRRRR